MGYLELAKRLFHELDGEHSIAETQARALVAIAGALVAIAELLAGGKK